MSSFHLFRHDLKKGATTAFIQKQDKIASMAKLGLVRTSHM